MKTWVRKTLSVGVLAAGALLFAPGAASADVRQGNGDNNGILNGTQIAVPVSVPVNVVGNSLGILGVANAAGVGVNRTEHGRGDVQSNGDNNGILNGSQAYLPVNVPVNVVGNAVAVAGGAHATGVGVNGRKAESRRTTEGGWWGGQSNGDNNGILNGTQIYAPIDAPINICGNSVALLGGAYSQALCANNVSGPRHRGWKRESSRTEGGWQSNGDNNGILNGTQLLAPVNLPVNLAGNSVAVLGAAGSRAVAVNESGRDGRFGQSNGDNNGILNGTQIGVPINVPINVCGNSLGILGAAHSAAGCVNGSTLPAFGDDHGWDGDHGHGWDNDHDGDHDHDHDYGHGHGHHPKPGHGHGDYDGDHGDHDGAVDDDRKDGYGGTKPATGGYGDEAPADEAPADEAPADEAPATGDQDEYPAGNGGRESAAVSSLTNAVGGLGLLSTLR